MSAPARICPRCHRTEGTPNNKGNPLRFNRKSGLCTGCYYTLLKNPGATPWRDPQAPKQTCARCGREEGTPTSRGTPLAFPGPHSKYAGYCHPCINVLASKNPDRPVMHRPNPRQRCKVCGRRHTKTNPIGGPGAKYPGFCRSCRIAVDYRSRTYPVRPCAGCGHTHNTRGRLLAVVATGPNAGLCERCRGKKRRQSKGDTP